MIKGKVKYVGASKYYANQTNFSVENVETFFKIDDEKITDKFKVGDVVVFFPRSKGFVDRVDVVQVHLPDPWEEEEDKYDDLP
jgi:tRNA A58 N-methylase Trm61